MDVRGGSMGLLSNVETHREMDYVLEALEILDEAQRKKISVKEVFDKIQEAVIREALKETKTQAEAARLMGMSINTLKNYLEKFGIRRTRAY